MVPGIELVPFILSRAAKNVAESCKTPWKAAAFSAAATAISVFFLQKWASNRVWDWQATVKTLLLKLPVVRKELDKEINKLEADLEAKFFKDFNLSNICKELPDSPWTEEDILKRLTTVAGKARDGKNTGAYYLDNERVDALILKVSHLARRTNPLHTDLSPLLRQLEGEIVRMAAHMFKGDASVCGNLTSGGTDSIRHAVFTARERAKSLGQGGGWEMVVPQTAHPAFAKAANEYGIALIRTPVNPQEFTADVNAVRQALTQNTILVAASCPSFPHGMIDPIEQLSELLAQEDPQGKIGLHVDACLGGFVVPFMHDAGYETGTRFGFDVARVTSISADTHKYGYSEKGSSIILYRNHDQWRCHQIFVETAWPGGIYATPTLPGSRPGRDIAAAWAVMAYLGRNGYIKETQHIIGQCRELVQKITSDPLLKESLVVMGEPKAMLVAFCSKSPIVNIYDLKSEMDKLGWTLSALQKPAGLHFCVTGVQGKNPFFIDHFLHDLKNALKSVLQYPPEKRSKSGDAAMYRTNAQFGASWFIPDLARVFWDITSRIEPKRVYDK